jgi:hypothetical protein
MSHDLALNIMLLMFALLSDVDRIIESKSLRDTASPKFIDEARTDLVTAIAIEKQVAVHSETVTVVPSEELCRSRPSLLKQQWTMRSVPWFPKSLNPAPDV